MNTGMDVNLLKIVLDTNILISAIGFGGKPRSIFNMVLDEKIQSFTSPVLLAELEDVVSKKFPALAYNFASSIEKIRESFKIVKPRISLRVSLDEDDNRVLEAAVAGDCELIITGDKDLLKLEKFKNIKIVTAEQFLENFKN